MVTPNTSLLQKMVGSPAFTEFIKNYNLVLSSFLGLVTLAILTLLFMNIARFSASADNEMKRRQSISGILVCLVCLAIAGGLDTIYVILLSFVFNFNG